MMLNSSSPFIISSRRCGLSSGCVTTVKPPSTPGASPWDSETVCPSSQPRLLTSPFADPSAVIHWVATSNLGLFRVCCPPFHPERQLT
jgi:hypothetical protein